MNPVKTDCIPKQFTFKQEKLPPVVVNFQGSKVTSDAGLSLIAEIGRKLQIYIFCGKHLLAAKLRASNIDTAEGALSELRRDFRF
jgi:hypothetical protein